MTARLTAVVAVVVCFVAATAQVPLSTFKVATWNIRSGMGIKGFTATWSSTTLNCTDKTQPLNAWGVGLPQKVLAGLKADPSIVALALQEAWHCGSPSNVNAVLGFKAASREEQGVALLARYGIAGSFEFRRIEPESNYWMVGAAVCLDAACARTLRMFSTHWGAKTPEDFPRLTQRAIDYLNMQPTPHLFMGDLNLFKIDKWNPKVPCTSEDVDGRVRAIAIVEGAGYVDVWKATQAGEGWTGMSSRRTCGKPSGSLFKRIDYVFVKGVPAAGATRFALVAPGAEAPSDHAGLVAELTPPDDTKCQ